MRALDRHSSEIAFSSAHVLLFHLPPNNGSSLRAFESHLGVMAGPSCCAAYFWLFLGGIFGLHHFYLRNDARAFIYCVTFGGLGLAVLWDLFWLPGYLRVVAHQDLYEGFAQYNSGWFVKMLCGSFFASTLTLWNADHVTVSTPPTFVDRIVTAAPAFCSWVGVALGVWLVTAAGLSNIQYKSFSLSEFVIWATIAVVSGAALSFFVPDPLNIVLLITVVFASYRTPKHDLLKVNESEDFDSVNETDEGGSRGRKTASCCWRFCKVYLLAVPIFALVAAKSLGSNVVTQTDAGPVTLSEALSNLWKSDVMTDFRGEVGHFIACLWHHNFAGHCVDRFRETLDFDGECQAYEVMELHWCSAGKDARLLHDYSELRNMIRKQYHILAKKYHPDKNKHHEKEMLEVNRANDLLKVIYETRAQKANAKQEL